ncbi:hypothetical protein M5X00_24315 [Paenibacillus alvei]|uniref:Chromo domain-containing protein n=1 Tax=Paenibacillus alvei TaxID=44250 RepID=A0ABT4H7E2_PAEAL|nr:hypothetical protein [Paenibacillus alvei]EJW14339.1 hypothetical protein PAV_14c00320 [Paenibacillus alvei DSM 29]MCY9542845.1 hypothetical protein [Paenibacillus alvei]MCY9736100.1 hypothetical protein [Paenibacillus alvei]MCY9757355.1 hypothetical protein [Paenibacillus alvei]MCY9764906.1 hypothetical protein [Paenibacillus alvei]
MESMAAYQKKILELIEWKSANTEIPLAVKEAVLHYKNELVMKVSDMQEPPFEVENDIELISDSFKDSGHFEGDIARVLDFQYELDSIGNRMYDVRVQWRDSSEESWIAAENFSLYSM